MAAENPLQTSRMFFGLLEMLFEAGSQLLVAGRFDHFGQSRNDLFLCAVEIL
jgi:predicted deacetylase